MARPLKIAKRTKATPATAAVVAPVAVDFVRAEVAEKIPEYDKIRDCLKGDVAVKARGTRYLPMPNPDDLSPGNMLRYTDYLTRAVFYNVTKRTLSGFVGEVFIIEPVITVPALLDSVVKDANGSGSSLKQLAQITEEHVLAYGRAGLFVDYPDQQKPTTRAEQMSGNIRPTISMYAPWNIINWRTATRNSQVDLTLVVLKEQYELYDDGFAIKYEDQYRVLRLDENGNYVQQVWRGNNGVWTVHKEHYPTDSKGNLLTNIPFTFVGAVDNDPSVDDAPMYDIADLNIAHYRNSADYEESCYITGQATPVITGLNQDWFDKVLKGRVEFGSRAAIALPVGAQADLLQMSANSAPFEAMQHKERQMVALGAKLVEQKSVQRTATETKADVISEKSILTTVTENVADGFKFSLEWCAIFAGATTVAKDATSDAIDFRLNTEYDFATATPEEIRVVIELWIKEAITFSEMREQLRDAGYATMDDDDAQVELEAARAAALKTVKGTVNDPFAGDENTPPDDDDDE